MRTKARHAPERSRFEKGRSSDLEASTHAVADNGRGLAALGCVPCDLAAERGRLIEAKAPSFFPCVLLVYTLRRCDNFLQRADVSERVYACWDELSSTSVETVRVHLS